MGTTDPVMEGWARLGIQAKDTVIAIRQSLTWLLQDSPEARRAYHDVISRSVEEIPDATLPSALKAALTDLDPIQLITHLRRLLEAGIPWMSERGIRRVALLAAPRPQFGTVRPLGSASLDGDIYWRLYLAVLGHPARISPEEVIPLIPKLPLPIVDDLVDIGVLGQDDGPWTYRKDTYESAYLRARLVPESITRADAEHISWAENVARHAFLDGDAVTGDDLLEILAALYAGANVDHFALRAMLPPLQRQLINDVMDGMSVGKWPEHVASDRKLWRLLDAQWARSMQEHDENRGAKTSRGSRLINATDGEFNAWRAFCATYRSILDGHIDRAVRQAESLEKADVHSDDLKAEINNMLAYLAQRPDQWKDEDLEKAETLLDRVRHLHPAVEDNLDIVHNRKLISVNNRTSWENPYFVLGLPHGDPDWNARWRDLSTDHRDDIEKLAALNDAWHRLTEAEKFGMPFFALPLDPAILEFPEGRSPALIPPLQPLPRRTETGVEDLQFLKSLAAPDLLVDFDTPGKGSN
ncbi:hypothetical protein [Microbispora amethystogenes]|uniref:Uncharacterized protein n=1 Tax=Microbispora amethystogenes TaxID=1427754 RepID=A0ABQ4FN77_9ACTN|nr:hypothetical protein [Microbispora amethystogenes]GIH36271.1 hypothetical protein Mam01_64350 [Microbispora amethystogenes]